jgi:hypothetical protein
MALGAAPVNSVALTRSFSEKISRFSVMLIAPFCSRAWPELNGSVSREARFYVAGNISRPLQSFSEYAILK